MEFYNREEELDFLSEKLGSDGSEFIVLYGRRRVGKTELVKEATDNDRSIYHLVSRETEKDQIEELKESVANSKPGIEDLKNDWLTVFKFIARNVDTLVIDEFPYMIETNEEILKILQKAWDQHMKDQDFNLVLTGSSIGMMESEVLGYKSPLYGRRTGEWKLEPFDYPEIQDFFPNYSRKEIIRTYSILGGTPYYLQQFDEESTLEQNILDNVLNPGTILREEAERLLQQELRKPKNYFSCLKAIAKGETRFNEIQNRTGIPQNSLSKYLKTLRNLQIVEKKLPVTASEKSKKGIYRIKDNYYSFWFRYIFPNQSMLQQDPKTVLENRIKPEIDTYTSKQFEEICRDYIRKKAEYDKVGSWWHHENEIDVAAVNNRKNTLLLGECKWTKRKPGEELLEKLKEKTGKVRWKNNDRKVKYILFSKNGFTEKLEEKEAELLTPEKLFKT